MNAKRAKIRPEKSARGENFGVPRVGKKSLSSEERNLVFGPRWEPLFPTPSPPLENVNKVATPIIICQQLFFC
jgi:hypothetical protein